MSKWEVPGSGSYNTRKAAEGVARGIAAGRAGGRKVTVERTTGRTLYKAGASVLSRCELSEREGTRRDTKKGFGGFFGG